MEASSVSKPLITQRVWLGSIKPLRVKFGSGVKFYLICWSVFQHDFITLFAKSNKNNTWPSDTFSFRLYLSLASGYQKISASNNS